LPDKFNAEQLAWLSQLESPPPLSDAVVVDSSESFPLIGEVSAVVDGEKPSLVLIQYRT
jgi:hypothetical protein